MSLETRLPESEIFGGEELRQFKREMKELEIKVKKEIQERQASDKSDKVTQSDVIDEENPDSKEYIAEKPKMILDHVFEEASKIKSNALYNIAHNEKKRPECKNFLTLVREGKYEEAKNVLKTLLPQMDSYINKYQGNDKVNLTSINDTLNDISDSVELGQTVLGIGQLFSRTPSVIGKGKRNYGFIKWINGGAETQERTIGDVLKQRNKEIKSNFDKSNLSDSLKTSYKNLINEAEAAMEKDSKWYNSKEKKAKAAHNVIGINLGNQNSLENPLLEPEIYKGLKIKFKDLEFEGKDEIISRTLENIINENSLVHSILRQNNIDLTGAELNIKIISNEGGKITFNLNGVDMTLSCNMNLGYYSQCVNPIILTDNFDLKIGRSRDTNELDGGNEKEDGSSQDEGSKHEITGGKEPGEEGSTSGLWGKLPYENPWGEIGGGNGDKVPGNLWYPPYMIPGDGKEGGGNEGKKPGNGELENGIGNPVDGGNEGKKPGNGELENGVGNPVDGGNGGKRPGNGELGNGIGNPVDGGNGGKKPGNGELGNGVGNPVDGGNGGKRPGNGGMEVGIGNPVDGGGKRKKKKAKEGKDSYILMPGEGKKPRREVIGRLEDPEKIRNGIDWIIQEMADEISAIVNTDSSKHWSEERLYLNTTNFEVDVKYKTVKIKTRGTSLNSPEKEANYNNRCEFNWATGEITAYVGARKYILPMRLKALTLDANGLPDGRNMQNRQVIEAFTRVGNLMNFLKAHGVFTQPGSLEEESGGIEVNNGFIGIGDTQLVSKTALDSIQGNYKQVGVDFNPVELAGMLTAMKLDLGNLNWNRDIENASDKLDEEHLRYVKKYMQTPIRTR